MDFEQEAWTVIEEQSADAEKILKDPSKVDKLLLQIEEKLKDVPLAGSLLADVPKMIAMVKAYITKDYTVVSTKVIIVMIASFLYLIKKKDLIPDNKAFVGYIDDIAVIGIALKFCEPELDAFSKWRDENVAKA